MTLKSDSRIRELIAEYVAKRKILTNQCETQAEALYSELQRKIAEIQAQNSTLASHYDAHS